jgi:hypothetical protein
VSERSDQVQKMMAVLARHADIVAKAFDGSVSGGDRQQQKSVDALFEIGAIKPYDEDTYRLNPRLREFLSDYLSSYHALKDLRSLTASVGQAQSLWTEMRFAKSRGTRANMEQLFWALDEATVDIAYGIEQNLHMLHVLIGNKYGNVDGLDAKLRQNRRYLRQIETFLSSIDKISLFSEKVREESIAAGLPEVRYLVSRRLGAQILKWSGLIKDAQAAIASRLFEARLLEARLKMLSGFALWLDRHKTAAGWDLPVDNLGPADVALLRPEPIKVRLQPDVVDGDPLINDDLLRVLSMLPAPKAVRMPPPLAAAQQLIDDNDEDLPEEALPSYVQALVALVQVVATSEVEISLLGWKREREDIQGLDDGAWLMYCYPRLHAQGLQLELVSAPDASRFQVNEPFEDIRVQRGARGQP